MNKLWNLYKNNSIIKFLFSYLFILVIPLIFLFIGFQYAFYVVERNSIESNMTVMKHSTSLVDTQLSSIRAVAWQLSQSNVFLSLAEKQYADSEYFLLAQQAGNDIYSLTYSHDISLIDTTYVYFYETDYVLYQNTLYHTSLFEKYIQELNMTMEEWLDICRNQVQSSSFRISEQGTLQYIMPFGYILSGDYLGVIAIPLNEAAWINMFGFLDEYQEYTFYMLNESDEILYSSSSSLSPETIPDDYSIHMQHSHANRDGNIRFDRTHLFYTTSDSFNFRYVLIVPEQEALHQLDTVKYVTFICIFAAIGIGLLFAGYLSVRQGKPLNEIANILSANFGKTTDTKQLGALVLHMVQDNAALMDELDKEKPIWEDALFHGLLKGDFANQTELKLLADRIGIEFSNPAFQIVCLRLFPNNDFYNVDTQTLTEVQIISHVIKEHIRSVCRHPVWFYKKNYLTTMAVFNVPKSIGSISSIIEETLRWALRTHSIDSTWGISTIYQELSELWKAGEEAAIAASCCGSNQVISYHPDLESSHGIYYPDLWESRLLICLQSGDTKELNFLLSVLKQENTVQRTLNHSLLLKLNSHIISTLQKLTLSSEQKELAMELANQAVITPHMDSNQYMERLHTLFHALCTDMDQIKTNRKSNLIKEMMLFIDGQYANPALGLSLIASEYHMSEGYISSLFKEQAGVNFAEYIEHIRIEKACRLLKETDTVISEIALSVGYNSVHSFRRAFKRVKGIIPTQYR